MASIFKSYSTEHSSGLLRTSPSFQSLSHSSIDLLDLNDSHQQRKIKIDKHLSKIIQQIGNFQFPQNFQRGPQVKLFFLDDDKNIYFGQYKNNSYGQLNYPHGRGQVYFSNGDYLIGAFKDGSLSQNYRLIKADGSYFQIKVQPENNKTIGILKSNNISYKGQIKNYEAHGYGEESTINYTFTGKFIEGQKYYGKLIFQKGEYEGQIRNNKFHGRGQLKTKDGIYVGQFKHGKKDGEGQFVWNDGSKYVGQFKNDKKHGKGKYSNSEVIFQGDWVQGRRQGTGHAIYTNGKALGGDWSSGKYSFPKIFF